MHDEQAGVDDPAEPDFGRAADVGREVVTVPRGEHIARSEAAAGEPPPQRRTSADVEIREGETKVRYLGVPK